MEGGLDEQGQKMGGERGKKKEENGWKREIRKKKDKRGWKGREGKKRVILPRFNSVAYSQEDNLCQDPAGVLYLAQLTPLKSCCPWWTQSQSSRKPQPKDSLRQPCPQGRLMPTSPGQKNGAVPSQWDPKLWPVSGCWVPKWNWIYLWRRWQKAGILLKV